jgi:glucose/arabinose dehydrogenase
MKAGSCLAWSAAVVLGSSGIASADMQGTGESGGWEKRVAVEPDPSKVVVPDGYEVGIFVKGLGAPSSATIDGDGNLWVVVAPPLLGSPEADQFEEAHVKVYDPQGQLIKEIGKGTFTSNVMNEISYCAENGKVYIPEYAEKIWEIDGADGELKVAVKDLMSGDHRNGGVTCRDGYLYFALGLPSNTGFADPDNHGWTDVPNDPFWVKHDSEGWGTTPHDAPCRDLVHTGLNVRSSDGRLTGAWLPVGVPAEPGMKIPAKVPCHGSVMRVALDQQGTDGTYAHESMEVYAFGFRNQSGVEFGPEGSRFENALAVSDNGANDLGNRRIANGAEKIWLVTEMGQDAGYPDKEGFLFVSGKRYGWTHYQGNPIERPHPNLYIGEEPFVPTIWPYKFQHHVAGVRGVPLTIANPNPDGYINPILEWDTNNPIDGIAWSATGFGKDAHLFGAVYGILDTGPESLVPTWPAVLDVEFLEPSGIKWSYFARNIEMGPNAYQKPENRGGLERPNDVVFSNDGRTMYIVDYGEVYTDFEMPSPFYTVPQSGVIWTVTRTGG